MLNRNLTLALKIMIKTKELTEILIDLRCIYKGIGC